MKKGENNTSIAVAIIGRARHETTLLTEKGGGYEEIDEVEEASNHYRIPQNVAYKLKVRKRKKR